MYIQYNKISVSVYFPKLVSSTVILTDLIYRNLSILFLCCVLLSLRCCIREMAPLVINSDKTLSVIYF